MQVETAKETIRNWLLEEEFGVRELHEPGVLFNLLVTDAQGRNVSVVQSANKTDKVEIAVKLRLDAGKMARIDAMDGKKRSEFLWGLRLALVNVGVGFVGVDLPLEEIVLHAIIFYDGLTKDEFFNRLFLLRRSWLLVVWMINREFEEAPRELGFMAGR